MVIETRSPTKEEDEYLVDSILENDCLKFYGSRLDGYYHSTMETISETLKLIPFSTGFYVNTCFGLFVFRDRLASMLLTLEDNQCEVIEF